MVDVCSLVVRDSHIIYTSVLSEKGLMITLETFQAFRFLVRRSFSGPSDSFGNYELLRHLRSRKSMSVKLQLGKVVDRSHSQCSF